MLVSMEANLKVCIKALIGGHHYDAEITATIFKRDVAFIERLIFSQLFCQRVLMKESKLPLIAASVEYKIHAITMAQSVLIVDLVRLRCYCISSRWPAHGLLGMELQETIANCFKHCGFINLSLPVTENCVDDDDEEDCLPLSVLLKRLRECGELSSDVTAKDYAAIDASLATDSQRQTRLMIKSLLW